MASSSSRMVSCPNPTMHDSRRDVFWPRILEMVDVTIPTRYSGNERAVLQARVAAARERLRTMDRERETGNCSPNAGPDQGTGRNNVGGAGCCSYCGDNFGMAPQNEGLTPVSVPCGHSGLVHANCLWNRADLVARGRADPQPCGTCSQEGPHGRRPPHPAEMVQHANLPHAGGRWDFLREQVSFASVLERNFFCWSMSEAGADLAGSFDSFEGMVRANGRSQTASWLLVTLFCDVFGMDRSVYISFPRNSVGNGWDRLVQRYRSAIYAGGIRPYQVLLRLPRGRIYIAPHVQEYLVHLDPECESHLTLYTLAVQSALRQPNQPLPPLPQVRDVDQRHDDWDEYYVPPARHSGPRGHGITPAAEPRQRMRGVGIDPGFDIDYDPVEDDEPLSQRGSPTTSPHGEEPRTTSTSSRRNNTHESPRRRSHSLAPSRPSRPSPCQRSRGTERDRSSSTPPQGRRRPLASGNAPDRTGTCADTSGAGNDPERRGATGRTSRPSVEGDGSIPPSRYGGCSGPMIEGHRVVQLPCGHPIHAGCVISTLERGGERSLLQCRAARCGAQHSRRDNLVAAVQADPGLRQRAERMIGGLTDEPSGVPTLYNWSQDSPGIGPALDAVSMDDLTLRIETVKKVQPQLASEHARLQTHVLQLVIKQLSESGGAPPATGTPPSILRAIKLWYLLPGLLHSFDGRVTRKGRYAALRRGDISSLLPWLMDYTKARRPRRRGAAQEATPEHKYNRAAQACRHSGGVKDAARALLAEQPSPGNDATWERLRAKFPDEDPASVEQAIEDAIAESRIEDEEGSVPRWRPEQEFDPKVLIAVIKSRSSNSGAGNDGQRFSHLKSIVNTKIGQEEFSEAMSSLWRKLVDDPNTFPPEFWTLWKQSSLIALGEKCRPVCIGMTWRRLIAAGIVREWKPKLEEVFREADQFGVAVAGGVERVAMGAQLVHQTGHWVVQTD